MADDTPEGWQVPQRIPMIAAAVIPLVLLILLLGSAWFYDRDLAPTRRAPTHSFPAPGIETYVHGGARDPHDAVVYPGPDPRIEAAKHAILAQGWPK
jgi:hypothetical protein